MIILMQLGHGAWYAEKQLSSPNIHWRKPYLRYRGR